jgi:hypothetical protein
MFPFRETYVSRGGNVGFRNGKRRKYGRVFFLMKSRLVNRILELVYE